MLRLKRVEISGFKSFYEKVDLSFPGAVTAVVGPNGCGKSNISDAVAWALGEQSARVLRGDLVGLDGEVLARIDQVAVRLPEQPLDLRPHGRILSRPSSIPRLEHPARVEVSR